MSFQLQTLETLAKILEPESLSLFLSISSTFTEDDVSYLEELLTEDRELANWFDVERQVEAETAEDFKIEDSRRKEIRLFLESTPATVCGDGMEMLATLEESMFTQHCSICPKCADAAKYLPFDSVQSCLADYLWMKLQRDQTRLADLLGISLDQRLVEFVQEWDKNEKKFSHLIRLRRVEPRSDDNAL